MKDIISQKICQKCCEVTSKMYEFRKTSLANDKRLRDESLRNLKDSIRIPHTEVTIKSGSNSDDVKKGQTRDTATDRTVFKVHPTVRDLFKVFPQIRLPTMCLKSHIAPFVSLPMDQVENYFERRKLDFNECTKLALRAGKTATKRTSSNHNSNNKSKTSKVTSIQHPDKRKVPPIKIVHNKCEENKAISTKVENENPIPENFPQERKRKFDELEITPKKDNSKKPLFIESLGLVPTVSVHPSTTTSTLTESPAYIANMSVPLHICNICNSVQYSAKELKKHQYKHLRCQFCKMKFRTQENKREHIDNSCVIRQTMHSLPNVELDKIECNLEIRRKYPRAFAELFPPLEGATNLDNTNKDITSDQANNSSGDKKSSETSIRQDSDETEPIVIEILSDDEELISSANKSLGAKGTSMQPNTQKPTNDNISCNAVAIVNPSIRIKGNDVLDKLDSRLSDMRILKELLSIKPAQATESKDVQTDLPTNKSITINRSDSTIELKQLKEQLCVFKIPVAIKFGPLNVSYNYQTNSRQPKKLCLWTDLMPIDIKTSKTVLNCSAKVSNMTVAKNNSVLNTSTTPIPIVNQSSNVNNNQQKCSTNISNVTSSSPTLFPTRTALGSSPKFIRINKSSLLNSSNIIDMNPLLNKYLHPPTASSTPTTTSVTSAVTSTNVPSITPVTSSSSTDTPVSSSNTSHAIIRVKNVWELT